MQELNRKKTSLLCKFNDSIKFITAALVEIAKAGVTLVHEASQQFQSTARLFVADGLELQNTNGVTENVQCPVVKIKLLHWNSKQSKRCTRIEIPI